MKLFKRTCLIVLSLLLISLIGLTLLLKNLDTEKYKPLIIKQISLATGRQAALDGDIQWHLLPSPSLTIKQLSLSNPAGFKSQQLVNIGAFKANVKLLPLLAGKIHFNAIELDDLTLNLLINKGGQDNWQFGSKAHEKQSNGDSLKTSTDKSSKPIINITELIIKNARINYANEKTQQKAQVQFKQFLLKDIDLEKTMTIQARTHFDYSEPPALKLKGNINLNASIFFDWEQYTKTNNLLGALSLDAKINGKPINLNQLTIDSLDTNLILKKQTISLKPLRVALYQGSSIAEVTFNQQTDSIEIVNTLSNVDAKALLKDLLGFELVEGKIDLTLKAHAEGLTAQDIKSTLKGKTKFSIKEGLLTHVDLDGMSSWVSKQVEAIKANQFKSILNEFSNKPATKDLSFAGKDTQFNVMTGVIEINEGKLRMDDLLLLSKQYEIKGRGYINLDKQELNYHLSVIDLHPSESVKGTQLLLGGSFPILIKGSLKKPVALPDVTTIYKQMNKTLLKNNAHKINKQLNSWGKDIKGLFSH